MKLWLASATAVASVLIGIGLVVSIAAFFLGFAVPEVLIGGFAGGTLFTICVHLMAAQRLFCRVCANPTLSTKGCSKHRKAKRFFGVSYRLQVAFAATLTGRCRCMYCGEPTFLIGCGSAPAGAPPIGVVDQSPANSGTIQPISAAIAPGEPHPVLPRTASFAPAALQPTAGHGQAAAPLRTAPFVTASQSPLVAASFAEAAHAADHTPVAARLALAPR